MGVKTVTEFGLFRPRIGIKQGVKLDVPFGVQDESPKIQEFRANVKNIVWNGNAIFGAVVCFCQSDFGFVNAEYGIFWKLLCQSDG